MEVGDGMWVGGGWLGSEFHEGPHLLRCTCSPWLPSPPPSRQWLAEPHCSNAALALD